MRVKAGWVGAFLVLLAAATTRAEPVAVRVPEGSTYGFLTLSDVTGERLAQGELTQTIDRGKVDSRLSFRFKDGSRYDERVAFLQQRVFSLVSYRLKQAGRSFPHPMDVDFHRPTGRYTVRWRPKPDRPEETLTGQMDLPDDVYNGMTSILLKNLPPAGTATAQMLAFTPKPRLLKMELVPDGEEPFWVGADSRKSARYLVKLELPGLIGILASAVGKEPPDLSYWILRGPVPAFLRFEGPFYLHGPIWRIELDRPRWQR
jgi:hypothetical protein